MIRLPASSITLGIGDLQDFDERKKHRQNFQARTDTQEHNVRFEIDAKDGACYENSPSTPLYYNDINEVDNYTTVHEIPQHPSDFPSENTSTTSQTPIVSELPNIANKPEDSSSRERVPSERLAFSIQQPSSPGKHDFYFGGFFEYSNAGAKPTPSSPFAPDEASSPSQLQLPDTTAARPRLLPRSPLFLSQNAASSSPEGRLTSSLSPRVASRVASYNSPGILFSQPARRSARFRHQTNSFSYDESERASAVYEQERIVSSSTMNSHLRPSDDLTLMEELRGSSLHSSAPNSSRSSASSGNDKDAPYLDQFIRTREMGGRDFIFSSPHLPLPLESLPPPFSSTSRGSSRASSLPSADQDLISAGASLTETPHVSPRLINRPRRHESANLIDSDLGMGRASSPTRLLRSATRRLSLQRAHSSSVRRNLPQPRTVSSPAVTQVSSPPSIEPVSGDSQPATPFRNYRIYDDSIGAASQPQTPAQLPEARHRSRFHPSYTAPVPGRTVSSGLRSYQYGDGVTGRPPRSTRNRGTPTRRGISRSGSPLGLTEEGFQGLFGGRENGNEEQDWIEGVRSTNVGVRLWGVRDTMSDGRNLRETPEREDWRLTRG